MIRHISALKHDTRKGLKFRLLSHQEAAPIIRQHNAQKVTAIDRPSPHEYTRILLAAKEGDIAPGEADRRIARMGGRVGVSKLPKPPEQ